MSQGITTVMLYAAGGLLTFDALLVGLLWKLDARARLHRLR